MTSVVERSRFGALVKPGLVELLSHTVGLLQLSQDDVETFEDDPNTFLADQESDVFNSSVRLNSAELLEVVGERFFMDALSALQPAIQTRIQQAEQLRQSQYPMWWKMREAISFAVGAVFKGWSKTYQERLMFEDVDAKNLPFDLRGFITSVLVPDVQPQSSLGLFALLSFVLLFILFFLRFLLYFALIASFSLPAANCSVGVFCGLADSLLLLLDCRQCVSPSSGTLVRWYRVGQFVGGRGRGGRKSCDVSRCRTL